MSAGTWLPSFLSTGMHQSVGRSLGWMVTAQLGQLAGMMTFVRVLTKDKYDHIMELRKKQEGNKPMKMDMPGMEHKHE